jgi:hypothetical protein
MGRGGVGGVAASGATEVGEAEEGGLGAVLLGGKTVGAFVRSTLGTAAVGALATYLYHTQAAPRINKAIGATAGRSVNDVAQGAIIGATLGNILPGFGTVVGGALGAGVGLVASLNRPLPQNTYQKALVAYAKAHPLANPELARAFVGVNASSFARTAASAGMSSSSIASVMGTSSTGGYVGAQQSQFDLSSAASKYAVTADSLKTASDDQKTAAQNTDTSATRLSSAASSLDLAAAHLGVLAGNAAAAFSPGNIHALAVAGTKTSVARK